VEFAFTSDMDWASEYAIENLVAIAAHHKIRPTCFVTHRSEILQSAAAEGLVELGIHPNFLAGSTQGSDVDSVIKYCLDLVPGATMVRCHSFVDGTHIASALVRHGLRVDSNLCLYMQENLVPLEHWSGLLRLPVFFEDDVHWVRNGEWEFDKYAQKFFTTGLKILNFHPFFVALNVPDSSFYTKHKAHIPTLSRQEAGALRFKGKGTYTFLLELIEAVIAAGHRFVPLSTIAKLR